MTPYKRFYVIVLACLAWTTVTSQTRYDSVSSSPGSLKTQTLQCYTLGEKTFCYARPAPFSFVRQVPATLSLAARKTFSRKGLPALSAVAVSTFILFGFDQRIKNESQEFGNDIHLSGRTRYANVVGFRLGTNYIPVYQAPHNLNTAIYSLGEGFTSMVLSGGMLVYGKMKHDNRALQTASQLVQAQLAVGLVTQTLKRISGRESPDVSTAPGGVWRPFVSFSNFQKHTSKYDAFPSGHLSTMMATVTVLASNYPEKKWLKPVGYFLTSLVGFAMINNGVHWSSDYPLALGIGYVCGKASVDLNRLVSCHK